MMDWLPLIELRRQAKLKRLARGAKAAGGRESDTPVARPSNRIIRFLAWWFLGD